MANPIRVLIVESHQAEAPVAKQLLNNYDLDFTLQSIDSERELPDVERHFKPDLVYCADDLPAAARSDALSLLYLLCLKTSVIHVVRTQDKWSKTFRSAQGPAPVHTRLKSFDDARQRKPLGTTPPLLADVAGHLVVIGDSAGWITYANGCASKILQGPRGQSIGTLLAPDHDFAAPPYGAQRLAIFEPGIGGAHPLHLSDLIERSIELVRMSPSALPVFARAFKGNCFEGDCIGSIAAQIIDEAGGRGTIARVGNDSILAVFPKPLLNANNAADGQAIMPSMHLLREARKTPAVPAMPVSSVATTAVPGAVTAEPSQLPTLEAGLGEALQRHAISVHYQPQFELQSGRGCGVEALARWQVASGDSIAPSIFIPAAERAGMIHSLGASVLKDACMMAAGWRGRDEERLTVAVNLSTLQINHAFTRTLGEIIDTSGLRASRLELEIDETAVLSNAELTATCMKEWKRLGVRVAVNHAGQNYSNLSYLSRLAINRLKLDKSLVQSMTSAKKSVPIVHALISLGAELEVEVIAEGVETSAQFQLLTELGCQQVQGYLFARPAPAVQAQLALRRSWGGLAKSARNSHAALATLAN